MDVLLILSSKLVSDEMKDLFGQIPSSLIPVNGKTLLEIIYENNKNKYDKIVVTGKEKVELINEVVKNKNDDLFYPAKSTTFAATLRKLSTKRFIAKR